MVVAMLSNVWRKSSASGPWTDNCVEVRMGDDGMVEVRELELPANEVLRVPAENWSAFIAGAKRGEFDL